jgi:WD40 repeat protein
MKIVNLACAMCLFASCTFTGKSESTAGNNENTIGAHEVDVQLVGSVVDVSVDENLILYEVPTDFTSEYSDVKLICYDIASKTSIQLSDSLKSNENLHSKFFNDTIVIVPSSNDVYLYNLRQRKYFDKLTNLHVNEYIYAFNINPERNKIAFIVFSSIEARFKIYCLDLVTNILSSVDHSLAEGYGDAEYFCSVHVFDEHVIYSLNSMLYRFDVESGVDQLLSSCLSFNAYGSYLFSVGSDGVVFIEGYDSNTKIKLCKLSSGNIDLAGLDVRVPSKYDEKIIMLNTIGYDDKYVVQLCLDSAYLFLNGNFYVQKDCLSFKGQKRVIKQVHDNVKDGFLIGERVE